MIEVNPLLLTGAVIGTITALLIAAYVLVKDKKSQMGFERTMKDGEIMHRLVAYAKPYWKQFVLVLFLMMFSIAYDIISPLIIGNIEELVAGDFVLPALYARVGGYVVVLLFSMGSTYLQAVILQRVGQRIVSDLREDLFTHIESLSHEQLNEIPVGNAGDPCDQRYQRDFDDVYEPAGQPDKECFCYCRHISCNDLLKL